MPPTLPPADPARLHRAALAHAAALLVEVVGEGELGEAITVEVSDGTVEIRVQVVRRQEVPTGNDRKTVTPARLTAMDRRILAAATGTEQTMKALAHHADHDADTYFRARVGKMVEVGLLVTEFGGYRLP